MKRNDVLILVILFALWMAWPFLDRQIKKRFFPTPPPAETAVEPESAVAPPPTAPFLHGAEPAEAPAAEPSAPETPAPAGEPRAPEQLFTLENDDAVFQLSSRGGTVVNVELKGYRATVERDSGPMVMDFRSAPALAVRGLPGMAQDGDLTASPASDGRSVRFQRQLPSGLLFRRTLSLPEQGFVLQVSDEFINTTTNVLFLPALSVQTGPMRLPPGSTTMAGLPHLGADTLMSGADGVRHWSNQIGKWFNAAAKQAGGRQPPFLDRTIEGSVDWAAVKNKYFVQIFTPEGGEVKCELHARRAINPREIEDPSFRPRFALDEVVAELRFPESGLEPDAAALVRTAEFYVGPKKYDVLQKQGRRQAEVMEFGFWSPISVVLLKTMNLLHRLIPNYGVAIILLTVLVRILFWPVTHKSTESMKKMQAIQPQVNEIRQKIKDPQKQQKAIMDLYRENKVNPLGGCLPMLIQIPVFIALFVVLRSAIELRFSGFLWIRDLSEPERLLAGVLPIPLNILPILMAVTMFWQQSLTPAAGADPAQQKMMQMMMPVLMLFFFYNFAAGLSLYWTTNQCLMIGQLLLQRRKQAGAGGGPAPAAA